MPAQFTLPPDTRAVGTGNPAADMNAHTDALAAMGAGLNILNAAFAGGADPTGATPSDAAFLAAAAAVPTGGALITVPSGTYLLNGSTAITLTQQGTSLWGVGSKATVIKIGASFSAASAIILAADSCEIRNISIVGASSTITSNPVCNGIGVNGSGQAVIADCYFQYVNGYAISAVSGAVNFNADLMVHSITARNCAALIHDLGNTGASFHGEHFYTDIEGQALGVTTGGSANLDGILFEDVQDVLLQGVNIGVAAGTGSGLHIKGACSSMSVSNMDLGGATTSTATVLIEDSANGSTGGVKFANGIVQGGLLGLSVTGATNQATFTSVLFTRSQGHGISFTSTGVANQFQACSFNTNNQANGTAYDFFFNSAAKLTVRDCIFQTTIGAGVGQVTNPCSFTGGDVTFAGCDFRGTNITVSNAFAAKPAIIRDCRNYNPVGNLVVSVPATTVAVSADSMDRVFYITAGASTCSCALSGSGATVLIPSGGFATIIVPARITLTPTYTSAPTWVVEGM